jgi:hypothetical protein
MATTQKCGVGIKLAPYMKHYVKYGVQETCHKLVLSRPCHVGKVCYLDVRMTGDSHLYRVPEDSNCNGML